jgi:hypothetical protein
MKKSRQTVPWIFREHPLNDRIDRSLFVKIILIKYEAFIGCPDSFEKGEGTGSLFVIMSGPLQD